MKSTDDDLQLATWLAAEEADQDDAAQAALHRLFRGLPRAQPSAEFADRVLRDAGQLTPRRPWHGRSWLPAAAALAVVSLAALVLTGLLAPASTGRVVAATIDGLLTASGWLSRLRDVLAMLGNLREACLAVAGMPQVGLIGLLSLAVSGLALRALAALTNRGGRVNYA